MSANHGTNHEADWLIWATSPSVLATYEARRFYRSSSSSKSFPGVTADSRDVRAVGRADDTSAALEHVVERFAGFIHQTAGRHGLSRDEQDAAVQEVRIRLWKALETSENIRSAPASYVYRTTVSAVVDYIRRRRARREETLEQPRVVEPLARRSDDADAHVRAGDVERAVERALGTLPAARQAVVRLHLAGYDRFEIADLMGWTEAKTRNHLYRSLELMRIHLKREGLDPGKRD